MPTKKDEIVAWTLVLRGRGKGEEGSKMFAKCGFCDFECDANDHDEADTMGEHIHDKHLNIILAFITEKRGGGHEQ